MNPTMTNPTTTAPPFTVIGAVATLNCQCGNLVNLSKPTIDSKHLSGVCGYCWQGWEIRKQGKVWEANQATQSATSNT